MKCNTQVLWTLVEQQADPGEEAEAVARHVESCQACQDTLSDLGGDSPWWRDAKEWLADEGSKGGLEGQGAGNAVPSGEGLELDLPPLPPVDLSFLEAPSHPEMLGRIGRYDVEGLLGRGGMGVVLRAFDSELQRSVAVKVLAPEWAASDTARRRFAREAQAAASVAHENVVPIYNVEASARLPFLVMRFIPGVTLERWVKTNGPLDTPTILRVAGQMAEGLAAAHRRGLIHRDIKPGNVLVGENIDRVWITDFGLARAADSMTLTRTGVIAGTPHYMSPEQARGEVIDQRSDLFSLGCVLYFLCTGQPPFDAENTLAVLHKIVSETAAPLTAWRDDLTPSFVLLVRQLLSRDADRRPRDCESVVATLTVAQAQLSNGQLARRHRRWASRRTWLYAAASALLVLATIGGWWMQQPASREAAGEILGITRYEEEGVLAVNPWKNTKEYAGEDPYAARASETIDRAAVIDRDRFRHEMMLLDQQIRRQELPIDAFLFPSESSEEKRWRDKMDEVNLLLQRASIWK